MSSLDDISERFTSSLDNVRGAIRIMQDDPNLSNLQELLAGANNTDYFLYALFREDYEVAANYHEFDAEELEERFDQLLNEDAAYMADKYPELQTHDDVPPEEAGLTEHEAALVINEE